jgi:hypothetical protein
MSVDSTIPNETNHSTSELRFLELEAGFKKHEELFKKFENFSKQLIEVKTTQVQYKPFLLSNYLFVFLTKTINFKKGIG